MATPRTAANRLNATATAFLMLALFTYFRLVERAGGRKNDRGYSMETVIITAGLVLLGIAIVAGITVVGMRYLAQIQ